MKRNHEGQPVANFTIIIKFLAIPAALAILVYFARDIMKPLEEEQNKTDCDFLKGYNGEILPSSKYYENDGHLFEQHKKCRDDKSEEALKIKRYHDANTICAFEKVSQSAIVASIYGSSSLDVCDPLWGDTAGLSYKLKQRGIVVWEGGGAGVMEAARYGSDAYSLGLSLTLLEKVIQSKCAEKTATPEEKIAIEKYITSHYTVQSVNDSYSVHGAVWLSRMPKRSHIGTGAWRAELYSIYSVLDIMSTQSDILIDIESPVTSYGTDLETAAGDAQIGYKPYLSPNKNQLIIHYGPNGYMPNRYDQAHVTHAKTPNLLMKHVDPFIRNDICVKNNALSACKNIFYSSVTTDDQLPKNIAELR